MTFDLWLAYVGTVLLLMSTPGPSHLLMLANNMAHGFNRSLATAAGDLSANMLQMLAAGFGLAALVMASEQSFLVIKWAGVAYLVWLGIRQIRASGASRGKAPAAAPSLRLLWLQGFVTSAANPKSVIFFAALFPQFLDLSEPLWPQLAVLGLTYVAIDGAFLSIYGSSARWLAKRLHGPARAWAGRLSGGGLIAAAVLLGFKTLRPAS